MRVRSLVVVLKSGALVVPIFFMLYFGIPTTYPLGFSLLKMDPADQLKKDLCRAVGHNYTDASPWICERCGKGPERVTLDFQISDKPKIKYSDISRRYNILDRAKERLDDGQSGKDSALPPTDA